MTAFIKKILVLLPVLLLGVYYLNDHYDEFLARTSFRRLVLLAAAFFILYAWIFLEVWFRKQRSLSGMAVQSGFYVYIFMVLTLTGYFIIFRELSMNSWWQKMMVRIDREDHVNFELFKIFRIYKLSHTQIIGNFIMLLPFGIFFPLLYKRFSNFFLVMIVSFFFSVAIEILQLVTRYRSADVDDVLLNTAGACFGYFIYKLVQLANPATDREMYRSTAALP